MNKPTLIGKTRTAVYTLHGRRSPTRNMRIRLDLRSHQAPVGRAPSGEGRRGLVVEDAVFRTIHWIHFTTVPTCRKIFINKLEISRINIGFLPGFKTRQLISDDYAVRGKLTIKGNLFPLETRHIMWFSHCRFFLSPFD